MTLEGKVMKRFRRVTLILVTIAIGYVIWIVWPHLAKVAVRNEAGVSESDVSEIVEHLERERSFYGRGELATVLSCLFSPSSRPRYFVEIVGDDRKVVITAGYVRGLQWGGGPIVHASKVDGRWVFEKATLLWRS